MGLFSNGWYTKGEDIMHEQLVKLNEAIREKNWFVALPILTTLIAGVRNIINQQHGFEIDEDGRLKECYRKN
jgi:hypothetical protein